MCECEKELALKFLPHQVTYGTEYGTQKRYLVTGFARNICPTCRGEREEAHPRKYGGLVERYYWREIYKTYLTMVLEWLAEKDLQTKDILEFEYSRFPTEAKLMKKEANRIWQKRHKEEPRYVFVNEPTETDFLSEVKVPERYLTAKYVQVQENGKNIGKWINQMGKPCSIEEVVADWYRDRGFSVKRCEGALISVLVGTFCASIILEPITPGGRFKLPANVADDFGSEKFSRRKSEDFEKLISTLDRTDGLEKSFEELLWPSANLWGYLWSGHDSVEMADLGRMAIKTMPQSLIIECIKWGFQHFWARRAGWPDLFVSKDKDFLFVEVKSTLARHHDKLSLDQMNWFRWAVEEVNMPCEIVRLQKDGGSARE